MTNTTTTDTAGELESADLEEPVHGLLELDLEDVPSAALARLIEEVRNEAIAGSRYNRTYHRHNR